MFSWSLCRGEGTKLPIPKFPCRMALVVFVAHSYLGMSSNKQPELNWDHHGGPGNLPRIQKFIHEQTNVKAAGKPAAQGSAGFVISSSSEL